MKRSPHAVIAAVAAAAGSAVSAASQSAGAVPGCGPGGACAGLSATRWAWVLGLPVGWAGMLVYAGFAAAILAGPRVASRAVPFLSWLIAGSVLWFLCLQIFLGTFCPVCGFIHGCGIVAVLTARRPAAGWRPIPAMAGLAPVAVLAAVQVMQTVPQRGRTVSLPPAASLPQRPGGSQDGSPAAVENAGFYHIAESSSGLLRFAGLEEPVSALEFPFIGHRGAAVPVLLLHDWTCVHCRELHRQLAARPAGGGYLLVPGYGSAEGEKLHRLMLAGFYADPAGYEEASHALLAGKTPLEPAAVNAVFRQRLGARRWEKSLAGTAARVEAMLRLGESLKGRTAVALRASTMPQIISPRAVLTGLPDGTRLAAFLADLPAQASEAQNLMAQAAAAKVPATSDRAEGAVIQFPSQTITSPPVTQGSLASMEVVFENTGTEPLEILGFNGGCGCIEARGVRQTVAPGARGSFTVEYRTAGQPPGTRTRALRLYSNAGNVPKGEASHVSIAVPVTLPVRAQSSERGLP